MSELVDERSIHLGSLPDKSADVDPARAKLQLVTRDAPDVQQIVEQPRHQSGLAIEDIARPLHFVGEGRLAALHQIDGAADWRSRGGELPRQGSTGLVPAP